MSTGASSPYELSESPVAHPAGAAAAQAPRRPASRVGAHLLVALSYLALAVVVYAPHSPFSDHRIVDCYCSDPVQEVWFLDWTAWAPLHGHNPFFTHYLNAPAGVNLALNTSFPLLGALGAPITWLAGPVVTYNVLLRLALAVSAFAMYAVLRRYTAWRLAAYAGGLLYGFSPYMIGHAHRHLFLTFVPLLPLFVPVVDDWLVRRRRGPVPSGMLLGLLVGGEFLISPEIALLIVGAVALGLAILGVVYRRALRERLGALGNGCVAALVVTGLLAGYPAYLLLFGPQRPVGAIHDLPALYAFHGDLAAPVVPTTGEYFAPHGSAADLVHGSIQENGYYLGIPLVLLLAVAVWRFRRVPLVHLSAAVGVVAFVLSLGKTLTVGGTRIVGHLPFALLAKLPVVQNLEPARLSVLLQLAAAIVLAVALDRWRTYGWRAGGRAGQADETGAAPVTRRRARTAAAGVLALAVLLPLTPRLPLATARVQVPRFFTSADVKVIPSGALILTYPYSRTPADVPMMWQVASGMRFRMFGGMAFVPDAHRRSTWAPNPPGPRAITLLLEAYRGLAPVVATEALAARLRAFIARYDVKAVVVDPEWTDAGAVTAVFRRALGVPRRIGGVDLWIVPPRSNTGRR